MSNTSNPSSNQEFVLLGKNVRPRDLKEPVLDTFPTPNDGLVITLKSDEVVGFCPVTGQPDFYEVVIRYLPIHSCVESKSLKYYLQSFLYRDQGIFAEALAAKIADDLFEAIKPGWITVEVLQKPRGGISIRAEAVREGESPDA